jgi:hypothetical protein
MVSKASKRRRAAATASTIDWQLRTDKMAKAWSLQLTQIDKECTSIQNQTGWIGFVVASLYVLWLIFAITFDFVDWKRFVSYMTQCQVLTWLTVEFTIVMAIIILPCGVNDKCVDVMLNGVKSSSAVIRQLNSVF